MELTGKFHRIFSNNGQDYYGIDIPPSSMEVFNTFLRLQGISESFIDNKQKRDRGHYHITVLNPMVTNKYRDNDAVNQFIQKYLEKDISVNCSGIGFASKKDKDILKSAWFSVCDNPELSKELISLGILQDLHITLAFNPGDVFQVRKNHDSLLYPIEDILHDTANFDVVANHSKFKQKL